MVLVIQCFWNNKSIKMKNKLVIAKVRDKGSERSMCTMTGSGGCGSSALGLGFNGLLSTAWLRYCTIVLKDAHWGNW